MKKYLIIVFIVFVGISVRAQEIISLEQAVEYNSTDDGIPDDVEYVKDINNKLNQFVGTWKGSYKGNNYEITLVKKKK